MIEIITKDEVFSKLKIPRFRYSNFDLHWTDYEDTELIVNLCYNRKNILEIGTYLGYTCENIAKNNSDSNILTIDICKDYNLNLKYQNSEILSREESGSKIKSKNVTKLIVESDEFFKTNELKFDAIFIDGDHSYEQVKKDTENSLLCLNENGIIIWHDVYNKDNSCAKCNAEPDNNDVAEYLKSLEFKVYKIEKSWVAVYGI